MSDNEAHRGFCELPSGEPMTFGDVANRVGKTLPEVKRALVEMARVGIFTVDSRGCIFCRRMARDTHISNVRRAAAASRKCTEKRAANGEFCSPFAGDFAGANDPAKQEQNPTVTVSVSDSDSDSDLLRQKQRVPATAIPSAGVSARFEEFWEKYPVKDGYPIAFGVWDGLVTSANESEVFACLDRYLASDRAARSPKNASNWLHDAARDRWKSDWPRPAPQKGLQRIPLYSPLELPKPSECEELAALEWITQNDPDPEIRDDAKRRLSNGARLTQKT